MEGGPRLFGPAQCLRPVDGGAVASRSSAVAAVRFSTSRPTLSKTGRYGPGWAGAHSMYVQAFAGPAAVTAAAGPQ